MTISLKKRLTLCGIAAVLTAAFCGAPTLAQTKERGALPEKHDSNTLSKLGKSIQYPIRKAGENVSKSTHKGAKDVQYGTRKNTNNLSINAHRAVGQNSVDRRHNGRRRHNTVVTPKGHLNRLVFSKLRSETPHGLFRAVRRFCLCHFRVNTTNLRYEGERTMNTLTKSLTALTLLSGALLSSAQASPAISDAPAQSAMTALLKSPVTPLPTGTKLLSIRVADGLATVNFSRELVDNFAGGDSAEMRAVNSILRTMGQFPTVSRVQLQVEGQSIDSLGGLLVLSEPLPVIRPTVQTLTTQSMHLHRKAAAKHH